MQVEVCWCDPGRGGGKVGVTAIMVEIEAGQGGERKINDLLALLPDDIRLAIQSGALSLACFGETRHPESPLKHGDRIELLGPVLLDVRAARAARVKAARARQRGPYNRGYSGKPPAV